MFEWCCFENKYLKFFLINESKDVKLNLKKISENIILAKIQLNLLF